MEKTLSVRSAINQFNLANRIHQQCARRMLLEGTEGKELEKALKDSSNSRLGICIDMRLTNFNGSSQKTSNSGNSTVHQKGKKNEDKNKKMV